MGKIIINPAKVALIQQENANREIESAKEALKSEYINAMITNNNVEIQKIKNNIQALDNIQKNQSLKNIKDQISVILNPVKTATR